MGKQIMHVIDTITQKQNKTKKNIIDRIKIKTAYCNVTTQVFININLKIFEIKNLKYQAK